MVQALPDAPQTRHSCKKDLCFLRRFLRMHFPALSLFRGPTVPPKNWDITIDNVGQLSSLFSSPPKGFRPLGLYEGFRTQHSSSSPVPQVFAIPTPNHGASFSERNKAFLMQDLFLRGLSHLTWQMVESLSYVLTSTSTQA